MQVYQLVKLKTLTLRALNHQKPVTLESFREGGFSVL